MADSVSDSHPDSSPLNDISKDLDHYAGLFTSHKARLSVGVAIRRNLTDVENLNRIMKKHRSAIQQMVESSKEGMVVVEREDSTVYEVDNTGEEFSDPDNLLSGCTYPDTIGKLNSILVTFDARVNNLATLSTAEFENCLEMFDSCCQYVYLQREKCTDIIESKNKLSQIIMEYLSALIETAEESLEQTGARGRRLGASMETDLFLKISNRLRYSQDELSILGEDVHKLFDVLNNLDEQIKQKEKKGETLWFNGNAEMYPYFVVQSFDTLARKNLICWVRADRKTMRRSMLNCEMTEKDKMSYNSQAGEVFLSEPLTLSSKDGKVLKAHETQIGIFIPFQLVQTDKGKEITVLITNRESEPYQRAEYKQVDNEGKPCILIERDRLSYLRVLVLLGPTLYEREVGQDGATLEPPTDESVRMEIPAGAVSEKTRVGIQSIPEVALPISLVKDFCSGLEATNSMVYPKLPRQMSKPANIKLNINNPPENKQQTHVLVNSNNGWSEQPNTRRSLSSGSIDVPITFDAKQVIVINTSNEVNSEEAKKVAEAISEAIQEAIVNFIVLQNDFDPHRLYIECCKREYTLDRVDKMKKMNFHEVSTFTDIFLKERAQVRVSCTNDIVFDLPRGQTEFDIQFSVELSRQTEVYIKPQADNPLPGSTLRGYIEFAAERKDVGINEIKLRQSEQSTETKLFLCSNPITLKLEAKEITPRETRKMKLEKLLECGDRIEDLLSKDDLFKLSEKLGLSSSRNVHSLKDILRIWLRSELVINDKHSGLSKALRTINKNTAANIVDRLRNDNAEEVKFVDVVKYLSRDGHVLRNTKTLLLTLDLDEADCVQLEYTHPNSLKDILIDGLFLWRSKLGSKATLEALVDALDSCEHKRAAEWLKEKMQ